MKEKVNDFGKFCRVLRIKNDMVLKEMADKLDVSAAYLSAVENGKRKVPSEWDQKISEIFNLSDSEHDELNSIVKLSQSQVFETLGIETFQGKEKLVQFARKCENIDDDAFKEIMKIIEGGKK